MIQPSMKGRFLSALFISVTTVLGQAALPTSLAPTQVLTSGTNRFQAFGNSVAIDGATLVVGAPYTDDFLTGAAYVFERENGSWVRKQRLSPNQSLPTFGFFGHSVAIHQNTIVVGVGNESGGP